VLSRYFEVMRGVLEEHGRLIEKYIGDAIMAVFGMPRVHEDDALRGTGVATSPSSRASAIDRRRNLQSRCILFGPPNIQIRRDVRPAIVPGGRQRCNSRILAVTHL
jgi:class 3 adenylate cyclase